MEWSGCDINAQVNAEGEVVSGSEQRAISRRQLFRGDLGGREVPRLPPWADAESEFLQRCERCDDCARSCPESIIRVGDGGYPVIDFDLGACTFCAECLTVCRGRALRGDPDCDPPWTLKAVIASTCLAEQGVVCRSCGEVCDERAIRFRLRVGGAAQPQLETELCTGCGRCVGVCPVRAVAIVAYGDKQQAS